jgi:ABC-2 type transport system ATP-binding protein
VGALVAATDLHKSFGDTLAIDGVSLSVAAGEVYGLVGPDGAGKTTTLRLLVGALTPDAGRVEVAGHDMARQTEQARAEIGYLAQRFSLYADLSVTENLGFFGRARGLAGERLARRAAELLEFVGLAGFETRRAEHLSGGMKQKLGLACALVHEPRVLLLDEPTAGVDPVTRQDFWQLLMRVVEGGAAVIACTPYMDEATRCQRVGFMHSGRILVEGRPRELVRALEGRVVELAAHPKEWARKIALADPAVEDALAFGDRFHLRVSDADAALARLPVALGGAGVAVSSLRSIAPSIEDLFIWLLAEQRA